MKKLPDKEPGRVLKEIEGFWEHKTATHLLCFLNLPIRVEEAGNEVPYRFGQFMRPSPITGDDCQDGNPTNFGADIDQNVSLMNFSHSDVAITGEFMKSVYAQKLDEMKTMFSIWTPPHWMKSGTAFIGQGCSSFKGHLTRTRLNCAISSSG